MPRLIAAIAFDNCAHDGGTLARGLEFGPHEVAADFPCSGFDSGRSSFGRLWLHGRDNRWDREADLLTRPRLEPPELQF